MTRNSLFDPYSTPHFDEAMQSLEFTTGGDIQYIAVYPVRNPGWTPLERIQFRGDVWQATFVPEPFVFPVIADHQLAERATEGPCVVITIGGAGSKPSEVVASARPLADAICGAILLTIGSASLEPRAYEGLITRAENRKLRFSAAKTNVSVPGLTKQGIEAEIQMISSVSSTLTALHLLSALRWYQKACLETHLLDRFIGFWLCILVIIRTWHTQNVGGDPPERTRFRDYIRGSLGLSGDEEERWFKALDDSYKLRMDIFKGSQLDAVTDVDVRRVRELAFDLLRFEIWRLPLSTPTFA